MSTYTCPKCREQISPITVLDDPKHIQIHCSLCGYSKAYTREEWVTQKKLNP